MIFYFLTSVTWKNDDLYTFETHIHVNFFPLIMKSLFFKNFSRNWDRRKTGEHVFAHWLLVSPYNRNFLRTFNNFFVVQGYL